LKYLSGLYDSDGKEITNPDNKCLIPVLFALSSDLKSNRIEGEQQRYAKILNGSIPALKSICILNKGIFILSSQIWHCIDSDNQNIEILYFLSTIMNTYNLLKSSRCEPRLGPYLIDAVN